MFDWGIHSVLPADYMFDWGVMSVGFGIRPQLTTATALDGMMVKVEFNELMEESTVIIPGNWTIEWWDGGGWAPSGITVTSVDNVDGIVFWVWLDIALNIGDQYRITAENMEDISGNLIAPPPDNQQTFLGVPIVTKLETAVPLTDRSLKLTFSKPMQRSSLQETGNYVLTALETGAAELYISSVVLPEDTYPEECTLIISEMTDAKDYKIQVTSDIIDQWGTACSSPFDEIEFEGEGTSPTISQVIATSQNTVEVTFGESMKDNLDIRNSSKYVFDGGLTVSAVLAVEGAKVTLSTSDQTEGTLYNLTVSP